MRNITFGNLLEKLLYLSKQKKSALAKTLGYDVSYLSKWTSGKNLPVPKNIYDVCLATSKFIVNSLTEETTSELKEYFKIDSEINSKEDLCKCINQLLREAYMYSTQKTIPIQQKNTYLDEEYNGTIHINPKLRKYYLNKDSTLDIDKCNKMDLIMSANLKKINSDDKISIADIKHELFSKRERIDARIRILFEFEENYEDIIFDTIMIINMIAMYPQMNFEVYNCDVASNSIITVIKDKLLYNASFTKDKKCLIATTSKDKHIVEEIYCNLDIMIKNHGILLVEKKGLTDMMAQKSFTQYFMSQDLRWVIGYMNELFMPEQLFNEVAESVYQEKEILENLNKINIVLQNITYKSKIRVFIYLPEIKNYIYTGKVNFFNKQIELSFEQRKQHINNLKELLINNENIEVKLIDGDLVEYFKDYRNISLFLSKNRSVIQTDYNEGVCNYAVIRDQGFSSLCDDFYETLWQEENQIIISDKDEIVDILEKELTYTSILNENLFAE